MVGNMCNCDVEGSKLASTLSVMVTGTDLLGTVFPTIGITRVKKQRWYANRSDWSESLTRAQYRQPATRRVGMLCREPCYGSAAAVIE